MQRKVEDDEKNIFCLVITFVIAPEIIKSSSMHQLYCIVPKLKFS